MREFKASKPSAPRPPGPIWELIWWCCTELQLLLSIDRQTSLPGRASKGTLLVQKGGVRYIDEAGVVSLLPTEFGASDLPAQRLDVVLDETRVLKRRLASSRLPLLRSFEMAELDLVANTPFRLDEVYILLPVAYTAPSENIYFVVKKKDIDQVIEKTFGAGRSIVNFWIHEEDRQHVIHDYFVNFFRSRQKITQIASRKNILTCALILLLASLIEVTRTLDDASIALESQISRLEPGVKKREAMQKVEAQRIAAIRTLFAEKEKYVAVGASIEELARLMPDNTHISEFHRQKNGLRISGFSDSAAKLIPLVDKSTIFKNPRLVSAVIKSTERDQERFEMEMELGPAK